MVSSIDEKKLEEIYIKDYDSKYDFIFSYDGEPIRSKPRDGFFIDNIEVTEEEFYKQLNN